MLFSSGKLYGKQSTQAPTHISLPDVDKKSAKIPDAVYVFRLFHIINSPYNRNNYNQYITFFPSSRLRESASDKNESRGSLLRRGIKKSDVRREETEYYNKNNYRRRK